MSLEAQQQLSRPAARPRPTARRREGLARPFMKWVGGKTRLLEQYADLFPRSFARYHEPFVGGGAVFFALGPSEATLCDTNAELVNVYRVVRDRVSSLIKNLQRHRYDKAHYYAVRAIDPATLDPVERAARTIFLNRCGFNGLYRLNKSGKFNVPFGRYSNPTICDEPNLRACARALGGVELVHSTYETVVDAAEEGDFVYFDPPYHPLSKTASFTEYVAGGFSDEDQVRLSILYKALTLKGVKAMLSNSSTPLIHTLYKDFDVRIVQAPRAVNSNPARRGKVPEVVVLNYPL